MSDDPLSDDALAPVVANCARHVLRHAHRGVSALELREQFAELRRLDARDRFRVHVLLCKEPELAVVVDGHQRVYFYGRREAPAGAFNVIEAKRDMEARKIAARCARYIIDVAGDERGITCTVLAQYVDAFREADAAEQRAVLDILKMTPGLAYLEDGNGLRFWPRQIAPEEAVRA